MKKANSGSATKRNVARKNRDEYLAAVGTLTRIRAVIRSAAPPEATEVISYRRHFMPRRMAGQFRSIFLNCRPAGKGQTITAHGGPEALTAHGIMRTT